jgi:hypothetical protein
MLGNPSRRSNNDPAEPASEEHCNLLLGRFYEWYIGDADSVLFLISFLVNAGKKKHTE